MMIKGLTPETHIHVHFGGSQIENKQIFYCHKFNFTFRYIDDVLSLNNPTFTEHLDQIYHIELEIKETTDSASYLDLFLEIYQKGKLVSSIYDKREDFNVPIVNLPYLRGIIPAPFAYWVNVSQLIRYSRA